MSARANRGYSLVIVLWLLMLLTTIAGSYAASARVESKLLAQSVQRAQAEGVASAGVWIALRDYLVANQDWSTRPPRVERTIEIGDAQAQVTLGDAAGLINLNEAPVEVLDSLLAHADVAPAERAQLVAAIIDWRDLDHAVTPGGAEDVEYQAARAIFGAKDAPFSTVDELRFVRGMTDEIYRRVAPALTVHGDSNRVDVGAAPAEVLLALPGADARAVDGVMRARADSRANDEPSSGRFDQRFILSGVVGDIVAVTATATVGGATARVRATARYARGEKEPIQILGWDTRDDR